MQVWEERGVQYNPAHRAKKIKWEGDTFSHVDWH